VKWRNVLIVAAVVVPLLVLLALGFRFDPHEVPSVLPGRPAPACALTDLEGAPQTLARLRGRPVVLNFWSTWCVPCEAEHHLLQSAARAYGDRVHFVGVVYQDEPEATRRYLARNGSAYLQLLDPGSRCSIDYGVAGVPETFFIDAGGVVRHKQAGPVTAAILRASIEPLLAGVSP
jgi:cytochrome c biogenesis protein CcmG/thiol:disulfide interchange protein DsbE